MVDSLSMMSLYPEKIVPIKKASLLKLRKEADKDPPHGEAASFVLSLFANSLECI